MLHADARSRGMMSAQEKRERIRRSLCYAELGNCWGESGKGFCGCKPIAVNLCPFESRFELSIRRTFLLKGTFCDGGA